MNHWQNLVGEWCAYLDAGEIDGDLTVTGNLQVDGDTTFAGTLDVDGQVSVGGELIVDSVVTAEDYAHTTEFYATLPPSLTAASTNMGMTAALPHKVTSSGSTWWYYSTLFSAVGLRAGDRITSVRVKFSGNAGLTPVSLEVAHYRSDTSIAYSTPVTLSTSSGYLTYAPLAGANSIEFHDTMLDLMWCRVGGQGSGVVIEQIDLSWDHPAVPSA